jgi:membrane-associated phospholipid phosphatase
MRAAMGAGVLLLLAWLVAPHLRTFLLGGASWTDMAVAQALHGASSPALIAFMQAISLLHSTAGLLTFAALGSLALWHTGRRAAVPLLLVTLPGGMLLNLAVKTVVQRGRPEWGYAYQVVESFSFPSGHTAGATLLYGLVVYGVWPRLRPAGARLALLAAAAAMVLLVGASRIVLGVHFFSDCVAGAMEALMWLGICLWGTQRLFAPQTEGHVA